MKQKTNNNQTIKKKKKRRYPHGLIALVHKRTGIPPMTVARALHKEYDSIKSRLVIKEAAAILDELGIA